MKIIIDRDALEELIYEYVEAAKRKVLAEQECDAAEKSLDKFFDDSEEKEGETK